MAVKPDQYPDWATDDVVNPISGQNNVATPPTEYNDFGWTLYQKPPRQWFNWLGRYTGFWVRYLDEMIDEITADGWVVTARILDLAVTKAKLAQSALWKTERIITANDTATLDDEFILVNCTSGNITLGLPDATLCAGKSLTIGKIDGTTNTITLDPSSTQTINSLSTLVIKKNRANVTIISDGSNWRINSQNISPTYAQSSSCGADTTTSSSYVDIANLSVTFETSGGDILAQLTPDGTESGNNGFIGLLISGTPGDPFTGQVDFRLLRGASVVGVYTAAYNGVIDSSGTSAVDYPSSLTFLDNPSAGSYVYKLQFKVSGGLTARCHNSILKVKELS